MLKLKSFLAVLCLCVVGSAALVGCGDKDRSADELIGVYNLAQMKIYYSNQTSSGSVPTFFDVDVNSGDEVTKALSEIVYEEYHNYQYAVTKNSDRFIFEKRVLNEQTGTYATEEAYSVEIRWDGSNEEFSLRNGNYIHHIALYNGRFYYDAVINNVGNTDFANRDLKAFMEANGMNQITVRYGLQAD